MFFDPKDIEYYKPVELWTKNKLKGNILESMGTKGLIKCIFSGYVKQNDTIAMSLYKRVFPKWPFTALSS
jgi:pre-rRNA-processing protein TSR1